MNKNDLFFPKEIEGQRVKLLKRNHAYDSDMWTLIDSSRLFLRRFLFWVDGIDALENVASSTTMFEKKWAEHETFDYLFISQKTGELVGAGGVHSLNYHSNSAEIGYFLAENQQGNGYVSEAVSLLENVLRKNGFHRVVLEIDEQNLKSIRVAQKAGYTFEGKMKDVYLAYDGYRTHDVYAKLIS